MGSADAARFKIDSDTIVNGDSDKLKLGDEVYLVYVGEIGNNPLAKTITIHRVKNKKYYVMDGVIKDVPRNGIVIGTKKKSYAFNIVDDTRIQNEKYMKEGHLVTITYVGELDDKPVAASIYCSKSTFDKEKKKETRVPTKPSSENPTKQTTTPQTTAATSTTVNPTTEAPTTETPTTEEPTTIEPTTEEPTTEEPTTEEPTTEEPTEPTPEPPTNAPDKKDDSALVVKGEGTILNWENPCTVKLNGGGTIELDISDTSMSGGYVPETGDQVMISYDKDKLKLLDVQLVYRPAKDTQNSDNDGSDNDGGNDNGDSGDDNGDNDSSVDEDAIMNDDE